MINKFFRPVVIAVCILFGFVLSVLAETSNQKIKLIVQNQELYDYLSEPITSGIPLSESLQIRDSQTLSITDEKGTEVPAQFRVLARWGKLTDKAKPIKWLLVDFQATVLARKTSIYYLCPKASIIRPPEGIRVQETGNEININTGAISFSVSRKRFSLIENVRFADGSPASQTSGIAGLIIKRKNIVYSSAYDQPEIRVEEQGPLRTVILIRGKFKDFLGNRFVGGDARMYWPAGNVYPAGEYYPLTFTARIHAYKNKSYLKISCTLENNGNTISYYFPVNDVFIDGYYLQIVPFLSQRITVESEGGPTSIDFYDKFTLYQDHQKNDLKDEAGNFRYVITKSGKVVYSGNRSKGWLDFNGSQGGLTIGTNSFWQNYPRSIEYEKGVLRIGLLPEIGAQPETTGPFTNYAVGNYYFSGGWHKTADIYLNFHQKSIGNKETKAIMTKLNNPLFAQCDPAWYTESKAWGLIAPAHSIKSKDRLMTEAFGRYEKFQLMFVDPKKEKEGRDIVRLRELRTLDRDHYGWENFGDMAHSWGLFSSLIYDWPYIMWLQFLRSGDTRFLLRAREMTDHSIDFDQIKDHDLTHGFDGTWFWEDIGSKLVNFHHKSLQGAGGIISHTWNGGYTLGYLLTGDVRYLEASKRSANAGRLFWSAKNSNRDAIGGQQVKFDQTRSQGWSILMLVNEYRITGDVENLKQALAIFKNSLLYTEQLPFSPGSNGKGYILVEKYPDSKIEGRAVVTFLTYPLEPLCELHYEASRIGLEKSQLEAYLIRSLNWLKTYAFVGGKKNAQGQYSLLTISYATDPINPGDNTGGELAHNIHVAGAFGYMSQVLKEKNSELSHQYLDFARQLFRDLMLYREIPKKEKDIYYDPSRFSPIGWGWIQTSPKEMGYIGRGGQLYLHAELKRVNEKF